MGVRLLSEGEQVVRSGGVRAKTDTQILYDLCLNRTGDELILQEYVEACDGSRKSEGRELFLSEVL